MDASLYQLHVNAGLKAGKERTCGAKVNYQSEESAQRAADQMNAKPKTRNLLEPYPCPFCQGWHIGRKMPLEELQLYLDG
jgi:hypothetical protein